jgi:hypothetical protein
MNQRDEAARQQILVRLADSRAEIRRLLEPPPDGSGEAGSAPGGAGGEFPRSRTMQMLMSGRGLGTVGAVLGGLVIARPALAWKLLRLLPTSAVARMLLVRAMAGLRGKNPSGKDPEANGAAP